MVVMRIGIAAATCLVFLGGCNRQPYVTDARLQRGLVIVLPGIEGRSLFNSAICRGLDKGGVNWAIELCDWTSHVPLGFLINLRLEYRNRDRAGEIAKRIVRYQEEYPDRPVVLVGQSGGGAIAAWTCEAMPPGRTIDGAIVLAASLSPEYPLATCLGKCRRGMVNFYSSHDVVLLWAGTIISGTMDGEHTSSAGRVGFAVPPPGVRPPEYKRLFQVPWSSEMAWRGNLGGHLTSGASSFVADYVSPLVLAPRWDSEVIAAVLRDAGEPGADEEELEMSARRAEEEAESGRSVTVQERAAELAAGRGRGHWPMAGEEAAGPVVGDAQGAGGACDAGEPVEESAPEVLPQRGGVPATQPAGAGEPTTRPADRPGGMWVMRS